MKKVLLFTIIFLCIILLISCSKIDPPKTETTPTTVVPTIDVTYDPSPANFMYHEVSDNMFSGEEGLFVSPESFEEQVKYLVDNDIPTKFTSEVLTTDGDFVVLTFDDGYKGLYDNAFPIIKKYNVKITIFLITEKIETKNHLSSEEIIEMSESGLVEFASHSCSHPYLDKLTDAEIKIELSNSKKFIEILTGKPVTTLAYPYGAYNDNVIRIAKELGYKMAYTTLEDLPGDNLYEQPRYTVWRDTPIENFVNFVINPTPITKK